MLALLSACSSAPPPTVPDVTATSSAPSTPILPTSSSTVAPADLLLSYEPVADGFEAPVLALPRPGTAELWVLEQGGLIIALADDGTRREVVDLTSLVDFGGERGLLGMAFAPDHATSGDFVVHYSAADRQGATRIERWSVAGEAVAVRGALVLEVPQPAANHNGGMVLFGPDGMLWVGLGDGGGAEDTYGNGQRPDTLLGTILRLDLSVEPYAIPGDNPFVDGVTAGDEPAAPEVWAWGLRNPWRIWIDEALLYIADVGQDRYEEVNVVGLDAGGGNFGWPIREGTHCTVGSHCPLDGATAPVVEYGHREGCSITGGVVNRGPAAAALDGHWFYSDFCSGFLRSFRVAADGSASDARDWTEQVGVPGQVLSFGTDHAGNVLVLTANGTILRVVAA